MKSGEQIVTELSRRLELRGYSSVEHLPEPITFTRPDLLIKSEKDKFVFLIEVKKGPRDEYLPSGLYLSINRMVNEAAMYYSERGYIFRAFLITNQKLSFKDLLTPDNSDAALDLITPIDTLDVDKIVSAIDSAVVGTKVKFDSHWNLLASSTREEERLCSVQMLAQLSPLLDRTKLKELIERIGNDPIPAIRGELCYLLGRWGKPDVIPRLLDYLTDSDKYVRRQATQALSRLRKSIDEQVKEQMSKEEQAYKAMEEDLLEKHPGQFAAFYREKLIAVRSDKVELMHAVEREIGRVRYYIRRISKELPKVRLPKSRRLWRTER